MENEVLRQRLYRIFRIEDENYMYTMKVFYIYRWVDARTPGLALEVITDLRKHYKQRKNTERLDMMFRHMQAANLQHYAAPIGSQPSSSRSVTYISGWRIG